MTNIVWQGYYNSVPVRRLGNFLNRWQDEDTGEKKMSKRTWVRPLAVGQMFTPNEYIASACAEGTIVCTEPLDLRKHTYCHIPATVELNSGVWSGYESTPITKRPIYNVEVTGWTAQTGTSYSAAWKSSYQGTEYSHSGSLYVTSVVPGHPNRS